MRKQAVNQASESKSMVVALEALRKGIARWTREGRPARDRDSGLVTFSAGCSHTAGELHVRAEHLFDRTRGQTGWCSEMMRMCMTLTIF